jgi:GNAT superfamily N-acetyltransferase
MMEYMGTEEPLAVAAVKAIHTGDTSVLEQLLAENPGLANVRLGDRCGLSRTLLHVVTDWPGHFPNGAATVAVLVEARADVNARFTGPHNETPLHWAASSNDVAVLDALLDAGADIEAPGAVIGGGSPLADARGFGQWRAARRLVERGARTTLKDAATLGLIDRVSAYLEASPPLSSDAVTEAFWGACHGGQRAAAELLLDRGGDINWIGHGDMTPLDIARASAAEGLASAADLVPWLVRQGAKSANEQRASGRRAFAFTVRRAAADDASSIASVLHEAFAPYEPQYTAEAFAATVPTPDVIRARWHEGPVWVALHGEAIVGTVAAVLKDGSAYVRSMAIARDARGHGLGAQLLEHVEEFARQHGIGRLFLSTTPFLVEAIRLYERHGLRRTPEGPQTLFGTPLITMEKPLLRGELEARE